MRKIGKMDHPQLRQYQVNILALLIANVETTKEAKAVINTLFSHSEKEAISQRFTILNQIFCGKKYFEVEGFLGTTSNTICKALDLYHKNGEDNKLFNQVLKRTKIPKFKFEPILSKKTDNSTRDTIKPHYPGAIKI